MLSLLHVRDFSGGLSQVMIHGAKVCTEARSHNKDEWHSFQTRKVFFG